MLTQVTVGLFLLLMICLTAAGYLALVWFDQHRR